MVCKPSFQDCPSQRHCGETRPVSTGTDLQGAVLPHWGWAVDLLAADYEGLAVPPVLPVLPVLLGDEGCQGVDCCPAPVCSQPLGFLVECQQEQTGEHLELAAPKQLAATLVVERNPV